MFVFLKDTLTAVSCVNFFKSPGVEQMKVFKLVCMFHKTTMETLSSNHTSHMIKNQMLLLAKNTKKTTGSGTKMIVFLCFMS